MRSIQRWGGGYVPTIHGILLKRSKLRRREYGGSLGSITLPYQLAIYAYVLMYIFHSLGNPPARPHMSSFLVWLHTYDGRRDRLWVNIVGNGLYVLYILVGGGDGGVTKKKKTITMYQGRV